MDGHLMFNHILRVKVMDKEKIHASLFVGANKEFRVPPRREKHIEKHNRKREPEEQQKVTKSLIKKDKLRKKRLEELGIKFDFPGYAATLPVRPKVTKL